MKHTDVPLDYESDCWVWTGAKVRTGYGILRRTMHEKSRNYYVHRLMFEFYNGEVSNDLQVCHSCDNRSCLNPNHLWVGTGKQNTRDAINKKRMMWQQPGYVKAPMSDEGREILSKMRRGEKSEFCKLTDGKIKQLRTDWESGIRNRFYLAQEYGVHPSYVFRVVKGTSRKYT